MEGAKGRATGLSSREGRRRVFVLMAARLCRFGGGESNPDEGVATGKEEEEMRIADVLHEQEEEKACNSGNRDGSSSSRRRRREQRRSGASSPSPRCLLPRWLLSKQFLRCRALEEDGEEVVVREKAEEEGGGVGGGVSSLRSTAGAPRKEVPAGKKEEEAVSSLEAMALRSECGDGPVRSEEGSVQRPAWKPEETHFNIGMGAGLVFLLTRSVTEFNKMVELRSEMEKLLEEIKGVAQKKDASPKAVDPKNNLACCSSESCGNVEWSNEPSVQECSHDPSLELAPEGSCTVELGEHSFCNKGYQEDKSLGIEQMEEELKSELELLQLNLDEQESSDLLSFELPCEKSDISDYFDENSVVEHPEPKEETEEEEEDTRDRYGVCPQELMSRLHELLEAQQEERIAELESALQLAHTKLREKEMEASWWRDTARLVSQHKQETQLK